MTQPPDKQPPLTQEELRQAKIDALLTLRQGYRLLLAGIDKELHLLGWKSRNERSDREERR